MHLLVGPEPFVKSHHTLRVSRPSRSSLDLFSRSLAILTDLSKLSLEVRNICCEAARTGGSSSS